jgi:hypothetical protein
LAADTTAIATESNAASPSKAGRVRLLTFADIDGRTRAKQRAEQLREGVLAERGGADRVDVMRRVHTDTWALLSAMIEDQLARLLIGEPVELAGVATLVNARRREGEVIGAPEPRDVTPSVSAYVAGLVDDEQVSAE